MECCACWAVLWFFQCLKTYRLTAKPPGLLQRSRTLKGRSSDRMVTVRSRYIQAYSLILLPNKSLLSVPGLSPSLCSATRSTPHRTEKPEETDIQTTIAIIPITRYLVDKRGEHTVLYKINTNAYIKSQKYYIINIILYSSHARAHTHARTHARTRTHTHLSLIHI